MTAEADRARLVEALEDIAGLDPDALDVGLAHPGSGWWQVVARQALAALARPGAAFTSLQPQPPTVTDDPAPGNSALPALESLSSTGQAPGACAWRLAPAPPCGHPASHPFHIACSLGTGFHDSNACHGYVDA